MSVQELIDALMQVEDKTIGIELYDCNGGERYEILSTDIITDGEPQYERNFDLNFYS